MPRNGSGSYALPAGNPFIPSTVISSTTMNNTMSDIGTALTQSLANDGQTTPVANLPMATFRHTNVGNAVARNDYAAAGQVQDSSLQWLTSVAGGDTITASISPGPTAYTAGQTFRFVAVGANTIGTPTLNINGLGAKNITKNGNSALTAGEIAIGEAVEVIYDGTQFQLIGSVGSGALIRVDVFLSSGTWTKPAGCRAALIRVIGGGGAGGGAPATGAGTGSVGGGGGAGGYAELFTDSLGATESVVVGTGGAGGVGLGGSGGNSSFGAIMTAIGGAGGQSAGPAASSFVAPGGAGGGASGGYVVAGGPGNFGFMETANFAGVGAPGGNSALGGGAANAGTNVSGNSATPNSGAGGGGACNGASQGSRSGGNGGSGVVIVWSFT